MIAFSELVNKLYFTSSTLAKSALIQRYLRENKDPDRGWAIAAIAGTLRFDLFKRRLIKELIEERVDPVLFALSYDYVGEMSETVSHLWQAQEGEASHQVIPSLDDLVTFFTHASKADMKQELISLLNGMDANQRWTLIKLGTRGLRIGVSARLLKKILAEHAQAHAQDISVEDVERIWHGVEAPYTNLLAWLEGTGDIPDVSDKLVFQPLMLSHPLEHENLQAMRAQDWQVEWKYDGIRVQLVSGSAGVALFTRTGDDISHSFPDIIQSIAEAQICGVFDGELLAMSEAGDIASFNQLQQRLNKKKPSKKLMQSYPCGLMLYDCLFINGDDLRALPLSHRRQHLSTWFARQTCALLHLSPVYKFTSVSELHRLREQSNQMQNGYIEGLMLKQLASQYVAGRPKGQWYKWKRDPKLIDAVIMYAQRGHGKRSSFYSDFTFGCWQDEQLLPIGKAYSGFTDQELQQLDKWVRKNTIGRFGPVKEVNKALVFEVAFDAVHVSKRHKSGMALRFPRIHRIRWDKPATEADSLDNLKQLLDH